MIQTNEIIHSIMIYVSEKYLLHYTLFTELTQKGSTLRDQVIRRLFGRRTDNNNKVCGVSYK